MKKKKSNDVKTLSPNIMTFTTAELCAIINACGNSGVLDFSVGDLRITFQARKNNGEDTTYTQSPGPVTAIASRFDPSVIQQDELNAKEDEISLLRIEDPLAYERLIMQRELTGIE